MAQKKQPRRGLLGRRRLSTERVSPSGTAAQPRNAKQSASSAEPGRRQTARPKAKEFGAFRWQPRLDVSGAQNPIIQNMLREFKRPFDQPMLLITIMLLVTGLIFILSASYPKGYYST